MPAARKASADLVEIIHRRMENGARLVTRSLPAECLKEVAGTASFPEMLVSILRHLPAISANELEVVEKLARTAEFKRDLIDRAGGALTAEQVRQLLGHKSVQAVHKAIASRRLLVVDDNGRKLFPAFQFDGAAIVPGIAALLAATPNTATWALLQFLVDGDEGLEGEHPIEMLKGPPEALDRLVSFARTLEV